MKDYKFIAFEWGKDKKEFNPIVVDGKIIEQPHINRVKQILKNYKK